MLMQEQPQTNLVHLIALRERKRAPHKPRHPLAQNAVEALDVAGLPCALTRRLMLSFGQNLGIRRPKIGVQQAALIRGRYALPQQAALIRGRYALPQQAASGFAAVANRIGHDLAGSAALGQPHPALVFAEPHEGPHLVEFQHVIRLGWHQGLAQGRKLARFFLATY